MKKIIYCAAIAAGLISASCTNDAPEAFQKENLNYGYIDLNASKDDAMLQTRAAQTADLSTWKVTVNKTGETSASQIDCSALATTPYEAGNYDIKVSNYANEAAAITANAAYYEGAETNVAIAKGANSVAIACGKAKNCRVKAVIEDGLSDLSISDVTLKVIQGELSRTLANNESGYFYAGEGKNITYTLDYKYNSDAKQQVTGTIIAVPVAATEYKFNVATNSNGKITLTVTYDDAFETGRTEIVTIDAAEGSIVK